MPEPFEQDSEAPSGPLTGLRVLELGNFIAAPSAGRLMADFGADVVKVERPRVGDELRRWRLHEGDTSLLFRAMNRSKRSVTLDLRRPEGREVALALIARADVVLENFRPGTLERWDLGPERMREVNPSVILVRISGYGQTGPYRDRPGFGGVAEAVGGLRHLTGDPDRPRPGWASASPTPWPVCTPSSAPWPRSTAAPRPGAGRSWTSPCTRRCTP